MELNYHLVAYPVSFNPRKLPREWSHRGKGKSFFADVDPMSRNFGVFAHRGLRANRTWKMKTGPSNVTQAWLYQIPGGIAIGLIGWDISKLTKKQLTNLDRPHVASTASLLSQLGLSTLDLNFTTAISMEFVNDTEAVEWRDCCLTVPESKDSYFVNQVLWRMVGALSIERHLLDSATKFLSRPILTARTARRHLANINGWIANPAIENANSARLYKYGREIFNLDARTVDLETALSAISRRGTESAIAGLSATALAFAITSSGVTGTENPWTPVILSVLIGIIAWGWSRGNR